MKKQTKSKTTKQAKAKKQNNNKYFDFYDDIKIDRRDIEW